jgi:hypothetical protein
MAWSRTRPHILTRTASPLSQGEQYHNYFPGVSIIHQFQAMLEILYDGGENVGVTTPSASESQTRISSCLPYRVRRLVISERL